MARLKDFYKETVIPKLTKDLGVKNAMQVPKLVKITVNMGVGEAVADRKVMDAAVEGIAPETPARDATRQVATQPGPRAAGRR